MQLNREEYERIFRKYLEGKANPEEVLFVEKYYDAYELSASYVEGLESSEQELLERKIKERIDGRLFGEMTLPKKPKRFFWLKQASIIVFLLGIGFATYKIGMTPSSLQQSKEIAKVKEDGEPKEVTLKLANGKTIHLTEKSPEKKIQEENGAIIVRSNSELVYSEMNAVKEEDLLYNELTVPKGKQFKLILSDGTQVWLNAASTLKYPLKFSSSNRHVFLNGEAFFDVKGDKDCPFTVRSRENMVKVLGTKFNVSAYDDESVVRTTLQEGSVMVSNKEQLIQLAPGEQVVNDVSRGLLTRKKVDLEMELSWRIGYFIFDEPVEEVLRKLARWYDLDVQIDRGIAHKRVAGRFSRDRDVKQVIASLAQISGFQYKIVGHRVQIISKK